MKIRATRKIEIRTKPGRRATTARNTTTLSPVDVLTLRIAQEKKK